MAFGLLLSETFELLRLNIQTFLVFCLAFLLAWLFVRRPRNLPPYPAGWRPVLGHLLALGRAPHVKLTEWRQQYGDVFTVRMGMEDVVVLNGYTAVNDALVNRSELFASRPPNYIFDLITGSGKGVATERWGNTFKQKRKFISTILKTLSSKDLEQQIREEAACLCEKVAEYRCMPFDISGDLHATIANVLCSMTFGQRFDYGDERFKELLQAVVSTMEKLGAGQLASMFPFLRFVPVVNRSVSDSALYAGRVQAFSWDEISRHRQDLDRENPRDFIDFCLMEVERKQKVKSLTDENVMYIAFDFLFGGTDTLTATLSWSLLYMVLNPDIQRTVQAEIDAVVGGNLPSLSHRPQMPCTEATLLEIQRIRNVGPLNLPHATTQDVNVGQFNIPAGTQVLMNMYSLHMDPVYWPDPDRFDPGRFLDAEGRVIRNPDSFMPFSGGRRVCPGEQIAKMELFLFFSTLLQNFTFKLPDGCASVPTEGIFGIVFKPHPHEICAIPR